MTLRICTLATLATYHAWYDKALADDSVWPYLSGEQRWSSYEIKNDDWHGVTAMDASGNGCVRLTIERGQDLSASISLWVLDIPARAMIAACMMRDLPPLLRRYGREWVDASCHASNAGCRKMLQRHFGEPWGIKRGNFWNGLLGRNEDSVHFRVEVDALERALNDRVQPIAEAA